MNYLKLYKNTVADGPGVRVSLYVSGCRNHCPGCHNPDSWDFSSGSEMTVSVVNELLESMDKTWIAGLTICGGEPMEPENQEFLVNLVKLVHTKFPTKTIWCYTGYEFEDLLEGGRKHTEFTNDLLSHIDVAVVGRFILEKRNITDGNRWRGSTNQRVIDVQASLNSGKTVLLAEIPNNEI